MDIQDLIEVRLSEIQETYAEAALAAAAEIDKLRDELVALQAQGIAH